MKNLRTRRAAWQGATVVAFAGAALAVSPLNPLTVQEQPAVPSTIAVQGVQQIPVGVRAPVLQEDDPGWDCRTMGNRVCGHPRPSWVHWKYVSS